ncbi:MAG: M48 family metalloprotease [Alphaproteobacteria bacterium]
MNFRHNICKSVVNFLVASTCLFAVQSASALSLIRDAEIEAYLKSWSKPIFQAAGLYVDNVEMLLVSSKDLNAFVAGGQNIFMHTQLLQRADNPEQILAVIAHETGHIAGGHLNKQATELAAAQLKALAATIIGVGASVLTEDSSAGILGSAAGSELARRNYLTFSRGQEQVADQSAVAYLRSVGLPPNGAAEFMRILESESRLYSSSGSTYGTTHPLTRDRIQAMDTAVQQSSFRGRKMSSQQHEEFKRIQAKLNGFILPYREVQRNYPASDRSISAQYAHAIGIYRRGELRRALPMMDNLLRAEPSNAYFHELKGQALLENGYLKEAAFAYQQAVALLPSEPLFRVGLGHALIESNDQEAIRQGIGHVNAGLAVDRDDASLWRLAATGYGKINQLGWSALCLAERALILGDYETAERQAKRAIEGLPNSTPGWQRAKDLRSTAIQSRKR